MSFLLTSLYCTIQYNTTSTTLIPHPTTTTTNTIILYTWHPTTALHCYFAPLIHFTTASLLHCALSLSPTPLSHYTHSISQYCFSTAWLSLCWTCTSSHFNTSTSLLQKIWCIYYASYYCLFILTLPQHVQPHTDQHKLHNALSLLDSRVTQPLYTLSHHTLK